MHSRDPVIIHQDIKPLNIMVSVVVTQIAICFLVVVLIVDCLSSTYFAHWDVYMHICQYFNVMLPPFRSVMISRVYLYVTWGFRRSDMPPRHPWQRFRMAPQEHFPIWLPKCSALDIGVQLWTFTHWAVYTLNCLGGGGCGQGWTGYKLCKRYAGPSKTHRLCLLPAIFAASSARCVVIVSN